MRAELKAAAAAERERIRALITEQRRERELHRHTYDQAANAASMWRAAEQISADAMSPLEAFPSRLSLTSATRGGGTVWRLEIHATDLSGHVTSSSEELVRDVAELLAGMWRGNGSAP